jgi:hypothetical protein
MRENVLAVYKRLLLLAKRLPEEKRSTSIEQIRMEFRRNSDESDPSRVEDMLKKANSSLGYLKIVTPKERNNQSGVTKIVFGNQSKISKAVSNWSGSNLDPDSVARHYRSLKRAGFRDNAHAKGFF